MTYLRYPMHTATKLVALTMFTLLTSLYGCRNAQTSDTAAPSTTVGTEVDDSVITTKVRAALMSNENIKSLDIKVKTNKGEVMLSGFADNQTQINLGIATAKSIEGVHSVDNKLSIKEGRQSVGNKIDDSIITTRIKAAMLADPVLKSFDVLVTTRKEEVQLSGFVNNETQLAHAIAVAKSINGVVSVVNHMSIKK